MNRYSVAAAAAACVLFVLVDPYSHGWRGDIVLPGNGGWLRTAVAVVDMLLLISLAAAATRTRFQLARTITMVELTWLVGTNAVYIAQDGWQRLESGLAAGLSLGLLLVGLALRLSVLVLLTRAVQGRLLGERST